MAVLELEPSIRCGEAAIGAEMSQCGNETLVDVQRSKFMELLEQIRALGHDLRKQWKRLHRVLSHKRTKLRSAEKKCSGFL